MTTPRYKYKLQLHDRPIGAFAGPAIIGAGGSCFATVAGSPTRAALTDKDGVALTQPVALTRGGVTFYSVESAVDLFVLCPDGQSVQMFSIGPDEAHTIPVDRSRPDQLMVIPITFADDTADNTETDTGWDEPARAIFKADAVAIDVHTLDAGETVDIGTATAETGDPDGLISAGSVNAEGIVRDNGALFSSGAAHTSTSKSIVFTFSAGVDTAKLYVYLPYCLLPDAVPTL